MYYSRPFKHQDRGRERGRSYEEHRGRGQDDRDQDESISGVLNNFSKALGRLILTIFSFYWNIFFFLLLKLQGPKRLSLSFSFTIVNKWTKTIRFSCNKHNWNFRFLSYYLQNLYVLANFCLIKLFAIKFSVKINILFCENGSLL